MNDRDYRPRQRLIKKKKKLNESVRDFEQKRMDVEVATYLQISHVSNHEIIRKELAFFFF